MASALFVLALASLATLVRAHEPPAGSALYQRGDRLVVRTGRGLIASVEGEAAGRRDFRLLCNEALQLTEPDVPSVVLRADGSLIVGTSHGALRVSSSLCEVRPVASLQGQRVSALVRDSLDEATLYAATDGGLFVSEDAGDTFMRRDAHALDSLATPAEGTSQLYATGRLPSAPTTQRAYFARWQPGRALSSFEFPLEAHEFGLALLGSDPREPSRVFAVARAYLGTQYPDRLLVSDDGALSWRSPLSSPGVAAFAVDPLDDDAWFVGGASGLWRAQGVDTTPTRVRGGSVSCLQRAEAGVYLCDGAGALGGVALATEGGERLVSVLRFNEVAGLADCEPDQPAVRLCQQAWQDWSREIPARAAVSAAVDEPVAELARDAEADLAPDDASSTEAADASLSAGDRVGSCSASTAWYGRYTGGASSRSHERHAVAFALGAFVLWGRRRRTATMNR